ncbi:MAG: hypothetical protein P8017_06645, partial [Deltaproteobacteria bacterium]
VIFPTWKRFIRKPGNLQAEPAPTIPPGGLLNKRPSRSVFVAGLLGEIRLFRQLAYPDVAKAERVAVVLQMDRSFVVLTVGRFFAVERSALDVEIVVHDDAVVEHRDSSLAGYFAVRVEQRAQETNVVALPLAGLAADVDHGRMLAVDRRRLAIRIGVIGLVVVVGVGIEHLDFVVVAFYSQSDIPGLEFAFAPGGFGKAGDFYNNLIVG